jgi:hypothetical protein
MTVGAVLRRYPFIGYVLGVVLLGGAIGALVWTAHELTSQDEVDLVTLWWFLGAFAAYALGVWVLRAARPDGQRASLRTYVISTFVLLLLAGSIFAVTDAISDHTNQIGACGEDQDPGDPPDRPLDRRVTLTSDLSTQDAETAFTGALGRRRRVVNERMTLDMALPTPTAAPTPEEGEEPPQEAPAVAAPRPVKPIPVDRFLADEVSTFRRSDGAVIPDESLVVVTRVVADDQVEVRICLDPLAPREVDAGEYAGVITITDPRTGGLEIPVKVTLQFNRWPILVLLLLATFVISAFIVWNGVRKLRDEHARLRLVDLKDFASWTRDNPVALGTGVAAAATIFTSRYINHPAWSGTISDALQLMGATGGAFVTATLVAAGITRPSDDDRTAPGAATADGVDDSRPPAELAAPDAGEPWGDPDDGGIALIPGRDYDPNDDPDEDPGEEDGDDDEQEEESVTANAVPRDGVDDARPAEALGDPDAGGPWGDPEDGGVDLIPGRDYDPDHDPDDEEDH